MKTMNPPGYHHNGVLETHAPWLMMYFMCPGSLIATNLSW